MLFMTAHAERRPSAPLETDFRAGLQLAVTAGVLLGTLLMPVTARAECAEPVECAPGRRVSRCVICTDERCSCWFKRSEGSDIGCTNGCSCDSQAAEVKAWCEADAADQPRSCGAAPAGLLTLWALCRHRRGATARAGLRDRLGTDDRGRVRHGYWVRFGPLLLLFVALGGSACAKQYIRVDASFPPAATADAPVTVAKATDEFKARAERPTLKTLVFRFPDGCFGAGDEKFAAPVLQPPCTPWLSELERAFRGQGYEVLSWSALRTLERQQQLTPLLAAQRLGAQVLLSFTELSSTQTTASSASGAQLVLSRATPAGDSVGAAQLTPEVEASVRATVEGRVAKLSARRTPSQTFVAEFSAVLPDSGAWFLAGKLSWTREGGALPPVRFLLRGRGQHWRAVWPRGLAPVSPADQTVAGSTPDLKATLHTAATVIARHFHAEVGG